jgi:hypothetical protein
MLRNGDVIVMYRNITVTCLSCCRYVSVTSQKYDIRACGASLYLLLNTSRMCEYNEINQCRVFFKFIKMLQVSGDSWVQ